MSNNTNLTSPLSDTIEVSIRLSVEAIVIIFSISLITCLIVQIRRGKEQFDSGFFHIYIILAICDTIGNLGSIVVLYLPVVLIEHLYEFYKANEHWLCGYVNLSGVVCLRISFIGQNFIALNRFTAVFLPIKHDRIWSKRNTNIVSAFMIILGAFLQSVGLLGDNPHYLGNFNGCSYGNFIGTNSAVNKVTGKTQSMTSGLTAIICITLSIATIIKLNLLRRNVYSVTLTSLEAILAITYFVNDNALATGGNISNQIYGWTLFLYLLAPSILLFLTSKTVRYCYLRFYLPKKWSYIWNSSQVISVQTTA